MQPATLRAILGVVAGVTSPSLLGCTAAHRPADRWHPRYQWIREVAPIVFRYDHGVLSGSYPDGVETVPVYFEDICAQLGHICICSAGGFRIAQLAVQHLSPGNPPERGQFVLISSRDHAVADVIAGVLGCSRRFKPQDNQYFVDPSIPAARREYHYYVGYLPAQKAVHILYRKHLLCGHRQMDELLAIEQSFENSPAAVPAAEVTRYQRAMAQMVFDLLYDRVPDVITVESVPFDAFAERLECLRRKAAENSPNGCGRGCRTDWSLLLSRTCSRRGRRRWKPRQQPGILTERSEFRRSLSSLISRSEATGCSCRQEPNILPRARGYRSVAPVHESRKDIAR